MSEDFPFLNTVRTSAVENLPTFKMYNWNFDKNKFGDMVLLEGNDALKIWIEKLMRTERFSYLAYSPRYGTEFKSLVGKVISAGERRAELRRYLIDALQTNPYILSVDSITFTENGVNLTIDIELTTVYGRITL